jgi:hypothetical protein
VISVIAALSFVLVAGFVATGLVGFFGWRRRMRAGTSFSVDRILRPANPARKPFANERRTSTAAEGARS